MKSKQEVQFLRRVLAQLDGQDHRKDDGLPREWSFLLWMVAFGVFLACFQLGGSSHWTAGLLGAACLACDYCFAHQTWKLMHTRQRPIIAGYLDRTKLEERLVEFGT